jgi:hypothetical protein
MGINAEVTGAREETPDSNRGSRVREEVASYFRDYWKYIFMFLSTYY